MGPGLLWICTVDIWKWLRWPLFLTNFNRLKCYRNIWKWMSWIFKFSDFLEFLWLCHLSPVKPHLDGPVAHFFRNPQNGQKIGPNFHKIGAKMVQISPKFSPKIAQKWGKIYPKWLSDFPFWPPFLLKFRAQDYPKNPKIFLQKFIAKREIFSGIFQEGPFL